VRKAIGVDLGGSHVTAGIVGDDGSILGQYEQDIEDRSFDAVLAAVKSVVDSALKDGKAKDAAAIGIGAPGNIDPHSGAVLYSPNFMWTDAPLGERLRKRKIPLVKVTLRFRGDKRHGAERLSACRQRYDDRRRNLKCVEQLQVPVALYIRAHDVGGDERYEHWLATAHDDI